MPKKQKIEGITKKKYVLYGNNFKKRRQELKLSQEEIAKVSSILNNKEDVSRLENGEPSFWSSRIAHELVDLCKTYQITMDEAFLEKPDLYSEVLNDKLVTNNSKLTADATTSNFKGYLGLFYCYFHSTARENKIIEGVLDVKIGDNNVCIATLKIDLGHENNQENERKIKEYKGEVIYSTQRKTAYFILKNEIIGEFVIMHCYQPDINEHDFNECRIANVISASAGVGKRHPVMFNMLIISKKLNEKQLKEIQSILLISNNYILLDKYCDKHEIPNEVLNATSIHKKNYRILSVKKFNLDNFRDKGINKYSERDLYRYLLKALDHSLNSEVNIDLDENLDIFQINKV